MAETPKQLYCYVDESGQDTKGKLFLVSVVIAEEDREKIATRLEQIERSSGKGLMKWQKSSFERRLGYLQAVVGSSVFVGKIFFSHYTQTQEYVDLTVLTTA